MTCVCFHCPTQESFWKNPQFELSLTEQDNEDDEDDDDDDDGEDGVDDGDAPSDEEKKRAEKKEKRSKQCTVLVELLQKNRRQKGKVHFLYIAFHVYKVAPLLLCCSAAFPFGLESHNKLQMETSINNNIAERFLQSEEGFFGKKSI